MKVTVTNLKSRIVNIKGADKTVYNFTSPDGVKYAVWDTPVREGEIIEGIEAGKKEYNGEVTTTLRVTGSYGQVAGSKDPDTEPMKKSDWARKDAMMAKMSAWKSACDLYSGTGKVEEAQILADLIYRDVTDVGAIDEAIVGGTPF